METECRDRELEPHGVAAVLDRRGGAVGSATEDERPHELSAAWAHLLERLTRPSELVASDAGEPNRIDSRPGMRHLMVLLAVGVDEALRVDPDPILAVCRTSTDDIVTWGMECPDCLYLRATLRGGETYRLFGNRGTARYVGLQTMNGIASTTNALVDELEVDSNGDFEVDPVRRRARRELAARSTVTTRP